MNGNTTQAPDTSLPIPMGIQQAQIWSKSLLATVHAISTSQGDESEIKESLFSIAELLGKVIEHIDQGVDEFDQRKTARPVSVHSYGTEPIPMPDGYFLIKEMAHYDALAIIKTACAALDESLEAGDPYITTLKTGIAALERDTIEPIELNQGAS